MSNNSELQQSCSNKRDEITRSNITYDEDSEEDDDDEDYSLESSYDQEVALMHNAASREVAGKRSKPSTRSSE